MVGKFGTRFMLNARGVMAAAVLALIGGSLTLTAADETNAPGMEVPKRLQYSKTDSVAVSYLLFLPPGYDAQGTKKWPLILFLHGAGERGTDVWKVATHGPPKNVRAHPDFPFIIVSPQCPDDQIWSKDTLLGLLDEVLKKYAIDRRRVYLTGLSMGGYGTWDLGLSYPERFAAIAPICGGGELITLLLSSRGKSDALKTLGIWAFHGTKDPVVPPLESERMVEAARRMGVKEVKLTVYPEAQHDAWTETYANPELYKWFLRHERSGN